MLFRSTLLFIALVTALAISVFSRADFFNSPSPFQSEPEFLPVDQAYKFHSSVEGEALVLSWEIAEGYYLYKDRTSAKTQDTTTALGTLNFDKAGEIKEDVYFGQVRVFYDRVEARLPIEKFSGQELLVNITYQGCADAGLCYPPETKQALFMRTDSAANSPTLETLEVDAGNASTISPKAHTASDQNNFSFTSPSLLTAIGFALLGGLILNLMPCVFPILALKAYKLAKTGHHQPQEIRWQAWAYTLGVLTLFIAIATVLMLLRAGGESIGWGFQLQSPWFVALLVYLFFALSLNLLGVFEISSRWIGLGQELTSGGGKRGAFFTGALAVIVATPCTAPFMGTALGYALTEPPAVGLLVFTALGLGLALPFLVLAYIPGAGKQLPKPGPWMDTFKQFLAFPLLLSALWLLWVAGRQSGLDAIIWILFGTVLIGFTSWLVGRHQKSATGMKPLTALLATASTVAALAFLSSPQLLPQQISASAETKNEGQFHISQIENLRKTGKTLFVNVTADWCVSCLVNEKAVLSQEPVAALLRSDRVAYIKGDWTNSDPVITDYLATFGRSGVPLYVVYKKGEAPQVLPQILTSSQVITALGFNEI